MSFDEFLNFIKVVKMLYGRQVACEIFEKNYKKYYNLKNASLYNFSTEME